MNGKSLIFLSTLFIALYYLMSASCSKDENPTSPDSDKTVVGDWKLTTIISEYQGVKDTLTESQINTMGLIWTMKINNDGTVEQVTNLGDSLVTIPGTWRVLANQLTFTFTVPTSGETSSMTYEYTRDGNLLKLKWQIQSGTKYQAYFSKQ